MFIGVKKFFSVSCGFGGDKTFMFWQVQSRVQRELFSSHQRAQGDTDKHNKYVRDEPKATFSCSARRGPHFLLNFAGQKIPNEKFQRGALIQPKKCDIWQLGGRDEGGGLWCHSQNPNITEGRNVLSRDRKSYLTIL